MSLRRSLLACPHLAISEVTHVVTWWILVSHERSGIARWLMGSVAEQLGTHRRSSGGPRYQPLEPNTMIEE